MRSIGGERLDDLAQHLAELRGRIVGAAGRRSQKAPSLAAVGRHLLDDPLAFEQVQAGEALAQLAGLGVAHVHAVADRERVGGGSEQRRLYLPGALLAVQRSPLGRCGVGKRAASAGPDAR